MSNPFKPKMSAEELLKTAKVRFVLSNPFFSCLVLRLEFKVIEDVEDAPTKTTITDGSTMWCNREYIESLSLDEVQTVLAQEALHLGLLHHTRMGDREKQKWEKASDYAVNSILHNSNFKLPPGSAHNSQWDNKSVEEIYTLLPDCPPCNKPQGAGNGNGDSWISSSEMAPPQSKEEEKRQEREWKEAFASACATARQQGTLPAGMDRLLDQLLEPEIDWKEELRKFLTDRKYTDPRWCHPNRRYIHQGIYLPSRAPEETGVVAVAIDTSGSIGEKELNEFGAELNSIIKDLKPEKVVLMWADAAVCKVQEFTYEDEIVLTPKGGGGTDFRPVFKYVDKHEIKPKALVYLTDGYGSFPDEPAPYPTMWVINNNQITPPWGEHLKIGVKK